VLAFAFCLVGFSEISILSGKRTVKSTHGLGVNSELDSQCTPTWAIHEGTYRKISVVFGSAFGGGLTYS
jgi:hypothetical protein